MSDAADILVLAGTREAVELSGRLGAACLTLRSDLPSPQRSVGGPFDAALKGAWRGIICGAHPFDAASAARVRALRPDVPLMEFRRPPWQSDGALSWKAVTSVEKAVAVMPAGGTVFAATGREAEPALSAYAGRVILRQNALHNEPPTAANITFQFGTRSFDVDAETHLFKELGVTLLLARNLGGSGGLGKLHAAARLGLPIFMLQRPAPVGLVAESAAEVRAWKEAL